MQYLYMQKMVIIDKTNILFHNKRYYFITRPLSPDRCGLPAACGLKEVIS